MIMGPQFAKALAYGTSAVLVLVTAAAWAHHSVAFYEREVTRVAGEIVDAKWRNPHVVLTIEAVNDRGIAESWTLETSSIYPLERAGVTEEMLSVGQQLVVTGRRSTRAPLTLLGLRGELRDGTEFPLWFQYTVENYDDEARLVDAAAENRGIFRVWSVPAANMFEAVEQLGGQPFTQAAIDARASWDIFDNFATRCEPEGMPRIMVNPHPFEFIDRGETIQLRTELYDIERVIHMNTDAPPPDASRSPLGFSVGRWDGDDLVVRTTHVSWPYFDNIGSPLSPDAEIRERFSLSGDQSRLDFEVVVDDPPNFSAPARLSGYWLALGEAISSFDCQN